MSKPDMIIVKNREELHSAQEINPNTIKIDYGDKNNPAIISDLRQKRSYTVCGDHYVMICGSNRIIAQEGSHIIARDNVNVYASDNAHVIARDNCEVEACGHSVITACGDSIIVARDDSCIYAKDKSVVIPFGNSIAKITHLNVNSSYIEMHSTLANPDLPVRSLAKEEWRDGYSKMNYMVKTDGIEFRS